MRVLNTVRFSPSCDTRGKTAFLKSEEVKLCCSMRSARTGAYILSALSLVKPQSENRPCCCMVLKRNFHDKIIRANICGLHRILHLILYLIDQGHSVRG